MFKKIKANLDIHTLEVVLNSAKTMIVKVVSMIAGLLISIFLGRILGSEGLGIVNFANKFGMILLILTMFGFQNVIIKFISIAKGERNDEDIATALKTSLIFNGLLSILIASIGAILLSFILDIWSYNQDLYIPLLIAFVMIIPQSISRVYGSALNGYGKIWQANLVNQTLSVLLVGVGLLIYWGLDIQFTPISVLILYALSRIFMALTVIILWKQTFRSKIRGRVNFKPMFKMAKPMLLVTSTGVIASNADAIMLGIFGTFNDVGIYSVAARLALMTSLFLQVTNSAIKPKMASLFRNNKIGEIRFMVQRITKGLTLVALLFVVFFLTLGQWILGFWGTEFQEAYWVLVILSIGQFFNIVTGCSGMLLVMCGHEKIHGYISLVSVILNIILNVILIANYGAFGAAIATTITVILSNISKVIMAKRKTGILTLPRYLNLNAK
jgi:O-antigen/teichoic acid export membrane protein